MDEKIRKSTLVRMSKSSLIASINSLRSSAGLRPLSCCSRSDVYYYLDLVREYEESYDLAHQKENEMAAKGNDKKKKAEAAAPEAAPEIVVSPERRALAILGEVLWDKPEERPDVANLSDDEVLMELKDNIDMLEPEDKEQVLGMEGGEEAWSLFASLKKGLAEEAVSKASKDSKASKLLRGSKTDEYTVGSSAQAIVDIVKGSKKPIKLEDIVARLVAKVKSGEVACKNPDGRAKQMLADAVKRGILSKTDGLYSYAK